jgi:hypothetical protein
VSPVLHAMLFCMTMILVRGLRILAVPVAARMVPRKSPALGPVMVLLVPPVGFNKITRIVAPEAVLGNVMVCKLPGAHWTNLPKLVDVSTGLPVTERNPNVTLVNDETPVTVRVLVVTPADPVINPLAVTAASVEAPAAFNVPPTQRFPPIPMPPATTTEPVDVLVAAVALVNETSPVTVDLPLTTPKP